ncbi:hypothetical protein SCHPADRAFT_941895 [Schizopora paradoxa]|uniref:F-box domain-containing protein n=1 Tax=Schizopora paradoxa TaxID=27342 RepID=A0A0H2RQC5_9AGAM|nr:hypothetical protein SCHPADRAFT_941895 [Schizopora paradoxa]
MTAMNLLALIDDILLAILSHSETCKQFERLTHSRGVWLVACEKYVLRRHLPFFTSGSRLDGLDAAELERRTCLALRVAKAWTGSISRPLTDAGGYPKPSKAITFDANSNGNFISELRFCPRWVGGKMEDWLLTVAKGIWSEISCWDLSGFKDSTWKEKIVGKWTRKGALIRDVVVNKDCSNDACLAVSLTQNDSHRIELLGIRRDDDDLSSVVFDTLATFESLHRVISLEGDICATSNDTTEIHILNWRKKCLGVLQYDDPTIADTIPARCLQVAFAHECIIVGFARSISLYPAFRLPFESSSGSLNSDETIAECHCYQPLATCRIDWTDCMSVVVPPTYPPDLDESTSEDLEDTLAPVLFLLRAESEDPWTSNVHTIMHYKLHPDRRFIEQQVPGPPEPNPRSTESENGASILPYEYPPATSAYMRYHRGFLRCPDLALGPCGTALWVNPRTRTSTGLVMEDARPPSPEDGQSSEEWLCGTVLPAGSASKEAQPIQKSGAYRLWTNPSSSGEASWTALDYVESLGWIGLGANDGSVTLLRMVDV